jgi:hypothetical protein
LEIVMEILFIKFDELQLYKSLSRVKNIKVSKGFFTVHF